MAVMSGDDIDRLIRAAERVATALERLLFRQPTSQADHTAMLAAEAAALAGYPVTALAEMEIEAKVIAAGKVRHLP